MGDFIEFLYSRFLLSNGVSIDTRTIQKDNLFFAISGENFDANQFANQALEKGASYVVVSDQSLAVDDRYIYTEDPLKALQELAVFHRKRFKRPVIGITGSNGKTTTKELMTDVLAKKYIVHATKGNYNNHIGVPLTLLHIHPQVEIAIIEMGANHVGEIAQLSAMAMPTHGLITNIGHAHTEGFGGFEGVIRGKSELYDYLRNSDGVTFINMNDKVLSKMTHRFKEPKLYPEEDLALIDADPYIRFTMGGEEVQTKLVGRYNFENIASAIAIGRAFEVGDELIGEAIAEYSPENARSEIVIKGSLTIILDAYNANPDSMKGALENLASMKGKKVAIIGDMNELENEEEEHQNILQFAQGLPIDSVITVGKKMGTANDGPTHFDEKTDLVKYLEDQHFEEAYVLLKASRSIQLETLVAHINP